LRRPPLRAVLVLAAVAGTLAAGVPSTSPTPPTPAALPPLAAEVPPLPPPDDAGLPPLPPTSPRNANYSIDARLDPQAHTIDGTLELHWRNVSKVTVQSFPFHLYWNAFRNNLSTSARGQGRRAARAENGDRGFGYTQVQSVKLVPAGGPETDITSTLRYVSPDDANPNDRTVMEVTTPAPVAPGAAASTGSRRSPTGTWDGRAG
jgi:hypothetical protein